MMNYEFGRSLLVISRRIFELGAVANDAHVEEELTQTEAMHVTYLYTMRLAPRGECV